jgi:hypothetical protein
MQNLRQLSGSELGQLLHCVSGLIAMRGALPTDLYIKLDTYRADLLAEEEDRPGRHINGQAGHGHCECVCTVEPRPGLVGADAGFLSLW